MHNIRLLLPSLKLSAHPPPTAPLIPAPSSALSPSDFPKGALCFSRTEFESGETDLCLEAGTASALQSWILVLREANSESLQDRILHLRRLLMAMTGSVQTDSPEAGGARAGEFQPLSPFTHHALGILYSVILKAAGKQLPCNTERGNWELASLDFSGMEVGGPWLCLEPGAQCPCQVTAGWFIVLCCILVLPEFSA